MTTTINHTETVGNINYHIVELRDEFTNKKGEFKSESNFYCMRKHFAFISNDDNILYLNSNFKNSIMYEKEFRMIREITKAQAKKESEFLNM